MQHDATTLTLQDIADLAHVRRPVVSMWRRRPVVRGERMPFPEATATIAGVERFDREKIVDWLERTGRGNNPDQRYDAAALAVPDGVDREDLITLLCLHTVTGEDLTGTTPGIRQTLAVEHDRADRFMLRELVGMEPTATVLRYVDDLVEASYGAADALSRLESGRLKRVGGGRELTPGLVDLMRAVAGACADHITPEGVPLVHTGDTSLSLALADAFLQLVVTGSSKSDRQLRRRSMIRGIDVGDALVTPHVAVCSVVGLEVGAVLDRVDEVVVELGQGDVAVVLGSASTLCDVLTGEQELDRSKTLRAGNLVLAVRLPRGLWREAHRQSLGLWVCQGGRNGQRLRVADLGAFSDDELDLNDLVADVAGALTNTDGRAFRYARSSELAPVLAGGPVVPRGVRALQMGIAGSTSHLDRITAATLITSESLEPLDILVEPAPGEVRLRQRSLGEMRDSQHLVMRRGSRIDPAHADQAGTVEVQSADRRAESIRLDAFDAARLYPRAVRTESGDVVFLERPRPAAFVDTGGGSLVASPSRILRLSHTARIGPHALAAVINEQARVGSEWETWTVPELRAAESERLEAALVEIHDFESRVHRRLDAAHALKKALIEGVAAGSVTLDTRSTTSGIHPKNIAKEVS